MSAIAPKLGTTPAAAAVRALLPEFVSQATHDLNNHLSQVLGKSELALMLGGEQRQHKNLEQVHQAGQEARLLVADLQRLVNWSRLDDESVPIASVLSLVERIIRPKLDRANIRLDAGTSEGQTTAPDAAAMCLMAWKLCMKGASKAAEGAHWSLVGFSEAAHWTVQIRAGEVWDLEERTGLERALRTGEESAGDVGEWLSVLRRVGADYRIEGDDHLLTFSRT